MSDRTLEQINACIQTAIVRFEAAEDGLRAALKKWANADAELRELKEEAERAIDGVCPWKVSPSGWAEAGCGAYGEGLLDGEGRPPKRCRHCARLVKVSS